MPTRFLFVPSRPPLHARSQRVCRGGALLGSVAALALLAGCGSTAWFQDEGPALTPAPGATTFVFIRHAEVPVAGLGQLSCRGLNRAIALVQRLPRRVGPPQAVFAPSPAVQKMESGQAYSYVRPLATVTPLAVQYGLPVQAQIGYDDAKGLANALDAADLRGRTVVIAWDHRTLPEAVRLILDRHQGPSASVPAWRGSDFDSIYVVRVPANKGPAAFIQMSQELDRLPQTCPGT